ncbi:helix-turn-helix domain-containing protein [Weeksellaceae bacterium A-14]
MYYLRLIQRFWDFNQKAKLSTTAVAVYLYLLNLANDNDGYEVTISDTAISNRLGIVRKTVKPAKEKLRALGLIRYENRNGLPCRYRLLLDYSFDSRSGDLKGQGNCNVENAQKKQVSGVLQEKKLPVQASIEVPPKVQNPNGSTTLSEALQEQQPQISNNNIPSWEDFFEYAKKLYDYESSLDQDIKEKYDLWSRNNWKNASGRPITNWKSTLKSILPYLNNSSKDRPIQLQDIPNIKRPESQINN